MPCRGSGGGGRASRRSSRGGCRAKKPKRSARRNSPLSCAAVARSWAQLLGEADGEPEPDERQAGMFSRLRDSLSKSRRALTEQIQAAAFDPGDDLAWERLHEALIHADVGVPATAELVRRLEARGDAGDLTEAVVDEASALLGEPDVLHVRERPSVVLVVGVNGTGKTTTIGKLAAKLSEHGRSVVVAAADTFRAAAEEQLEIWATRAGADFVGSERGGDPAAVAFDAIGAAQARGRDIVVVDTAGRLHTQTNLMEELAKVRRVIGQRLEGAPHETLLVIDATTGQNGLQQARLFGQAGNVTGVALAKRALVGTAPETAARVLERLLDLPGRGEELSAELYALALEEIAAGAEPRPGAVELLGALDGRWPVAVASNSPRSHLLAGLNRTGLVEASASDTASQGSGGRSPIPMSSLSA